MKARVLFFVCLAGAFLFLQCKNDLVEAPTMQAITSSRNGDDAGILPPSAFSASQGGYRAVTLSWKESTNAAHYNIYSADTFYGEKTQCGEAKSGTTSFTVKEEPGCNKYYYITAVNYSGAESAFSDYARGSTLAIPTVSVEPDSSGTSASVYWWMQNCYEDTYANDLVFELEYNAPGGTTEPKTISYEEAKTEDSRSFKIAITGLLPNTTYTYQVFATLLSDQTNSEASTKQEFDSAHKTLPSKPEHFAAAQGQSTDAVEVTWTLPPFVDTKVSGGWEKRPLYFTLERKPAGAEDSAYETIASYIGTQVDENQHKGIYAFNVQTGTASSPLSIVAYTESTEENDASYPEYIPLSTITFKDSQNIERGKKYMYRVQSYVDYGALGTTTLSSADSAASATGWALAVPQLKVSASATKAQDGTTYSSMAVTFTPTFAPLGVEYTYIIEETYTDFHNTSQKETKLLYTLGSLESISAAKREFTFSQTDETKSDYGKQGYYQYTLFILPQGTSQTANALDSVTQAGRITVTNDPSLQAKIEHFSVQDGYKDKFIIAWDYDENCAYTLSWQNYNEDNSPGERGIKEFSAQEISAFVQGSQVSYAHPAESGERRVYTLTADNGIPAEETYLADSPVETLGTPTLSVTEIDYDKLSLTWKSVQKTDGTTNAYSIYAFYAESGESTNLSTSENTQLTIADATVRCVIEKPAGYDDAAQSGKDITIKVVAKNNTTQDTTESSIVSRTLGPALVAAKVANQNPEEERIAISWNEVSGASGYIIHRVLYETPAATVSDKNRADTYYYDVSSKKITVDGDDTGSRAQVAVQNASFALTDIYKEADSSDGTNPYQEHQAALPWGLPCGYVILPVKDSADFTFDAANHTLQSDSKVSYKNLAETKAATLGYGLDVMAQKAQNGTVQELSWTAPFNKNATPYLFRRLAGSNDDWEYVTDAPSSSATTLTYEPTGADRYKAFEYAVRYGKKNTNFAPSYIKTILSKEETRYDYGSRAVEKANKGYLLAIPFSAKYGGTLNTSGTYEKDKNYYSEKLEWTAWDYDERALGPDSAEIYVKNYNLSSEWLPLASLDTECHFTSAEPSVENTKIWQNGNTAIYLAPEHFSMEEVNGTLMLNTAGPLQVLRDAKHYYYLKLTRGTVFAPTEPDDSIYASRQITDAELTKIVMLSLEKAIVDTGMESKTTGTWSWFSTSTDSVAGYSGSFGWSQDSDSKFNWYIQDYVAGFTKLPNSTKSTPSILKLSDPNTESSGNRRGRKNAKQIIYFCYDKTGEHDFDTNSLISIHVTSSDTNINLESYSAEFKFAVGTPAHRSGTFSLGWSWDTPVFIAQIYRNNELSTSFKSEGRENIKCWTPINLYDEKDGKAYGNNEYNSTYGWWPEGN